MKQFFLILTVFLSISAIGQKCPPGYSRLTFYSTGSVLYLMDTCYPDSVYKRMVLQSRKNDCGETGSFTMELHGNYYFHEHRETWISDSVGCEHKEVYGKYINGKEVELSKCQFYYESGWCNSKKSCCGHIHKTKP